MEPLAVHGGKPVRDTPLGYGRQYVDEDEVRIELRCLVVKPGCGSVKQIRISVSFFPQCPR